MAGFPFGRRPATGLIQPAARTETRRGADKQAVGQFAGYFFVTVPEIDEAIAWAKRCPSSKYGSIEIRPVVEAQGNWK